MKKCFFIVIVALLLTGCGATHNSKRPFEFTEANWSTTSEELFVLYGNEDDSLELYDGGKRYIYKDIGYDGYVGSLTFDFNSKEKLTKVQFETTYSENSKEIENQYDIERDRIVQKHGESDSIVEGGGMYAEVWRLEDMAIGISRTISEELNVYSFCFDYTNSELIDTQEYSDNQLVEQSTFPFTLVSWETTEEQLTSLYGDCSESYENTYGGLCYVYNDISFNGYPGLLRFFYDQDGNLAMTRFESLFDSLDEKISEQYDEQREWIIERYNEPSTVVDEEGVYGEVWKGEGFSVAISKYNLEIINCYKFEMSFALNANISEEEILE